MKEKEYVPFGDEWKAEMMKMKKADLIDMYKKAMIEREFASVLTLAETFLERYGNKAKGGT